MALLKKIHLPIVLTMKWGSLTLGIMAQGPSHWYIITEWFLTEKFIKNFILIYPFCRTEVLGSAKVQLIWQEIWRFSICLFKVSWNDYLVSYFSLQHRYRIITNILHLTFSRAEFQISLWTRVSPVWAEKSSSLQISLWTGVSPELPGKVSNLQMSLQTGVTPA